MDSQPTATALTCHMRKCGKDSCGMLWMRSGMENSSPPSIPAPIPKIDHQMADSMKFLAALPSRLLKTASSNIVAPLGFLFYQRQILTYLQLSKSVGS